MHLVMIGDEFVDAGKVDSAYFDYGTFFGDGVYEVLRSYNGRLFALDEHLERFKRSLAEVEIEGIDIKTVCDRVLLAYQRSGLADAKIYFHITRGSGARDHASEGLTPRFFLTVSEIEDATSQKQNGIAVLTVPDTRWKRCDIKSLNLLPNVLAKRTAHKRDCDEAIFVDDTGFITEGASSAFFAVFGRILHTSPLGVNILPSITRKFVLELAEKIGLQVQQEQLKADEAAGADELFIAVSSKDVVPVVKFNEIQIADGKPGRYTKLLIKEFAKLVKEK
jgi:D-alanine transaminase